MPNMNDKPQIPLDNGNPIKDNMSMLNPTDMAYMKQSGNFNSDLSGQTVEDALRNVLGQFGINFDDPAERLVEFGIKQIENADPAKKMQNIAGQGNNEPMPPAPPQGMSSEPASPQLPGNSALEGLLG